MNQWQGLQWDKWLYYIRCEIKASLKVQASDRRWHMPLMAALATGLPIFVGVYFNRLDYGLVSSLGGLVFLYTPATALRHRLIIVMVAAFGMIACFAAGLFSGMLFGLAVPVVGLMTLVSNLFVRYYHIGPPGTIFIVMAGCIAVFMPVSPMEVPLYVGLLTMGTLLACLIAFVYGLFTTHNRNDLPTPPLPDWVFSDLLIDSVIIGIAVATSLWLALLLDLPRPYWAPVSCLAVVSGVNFRAAWVKHIHRIFGTAIGLVAAWFLLSIPFEPWQVAFVMMFLSFIIEVLVVRHYGFATVFITPMTIYYFPM